MITNSKSQNVNWTVANPDRQYPRHLYEAKLTGGIELIPLVMTVN